MITSGDVLLAASDYLINENSMKKDEDIRSHIYDFIVKNVVIFVSDKDSRLDPFIKEVMDFRGQGCGFGPCCGRNRRRMRLLYNNR